MFDVPRAVERKAVSSPRSTGGTWAIGLPAEEKLALDRGRASWTRNLSTVVGFPIFGGVGDAKPLFTKHVNKGGNERCVSFLEHYSMPEEMGKRFFRVCQS